MRVSAVIMLTSMLLAVSFGAPKPQNTFFGIPAIGGLDAGVATALGVGGLAGAVVAGGLLGKKAADATNNLLRGNRNNNRGYRYNYHRGRRSAQPIDYGYEAPDYLY